jgi:basic amino acid/polyamine antiporter, APA family
VSTDSMESAAVRELENNAAVAPKQHLSVWHAMSICIGMVIGAGIFKTSPMVAQSLDSANALYLAWFIGGALSLVGALCFAEISAGFPDAGGDYYFLRKAYGARTSFLFAWSRFAIIHTGSMALLAFVCADYVNQVVPLGPFGSGAFAAVVIAGLTLLNLRGVRIGLGAQVALVLLVVVGLSCVVAGGLWLTISGAAQPATQVPRESVAWGTAYVFVFLAYGGWSDASTLSAEMKDERRGIVWALIGGMLVVALLYVTANWAYVRGLGLDGLAKSDAPAADLMRVAFGKTGEWLIVVIVAITAISVMNAILITGARTTYAAARDVPALAKLGVWDTSRGIPPVSLVAMGLVAIVLVGFGTATRGGFSTMVDYLSPVYWAFCSLSAASVIILRNKFPNVSRPYRVPFFPWLPMVFCGTCLYLLYSSVAYVALGAAVGVAVLMLGIVLMLVLERARPLSLK